MTEYDKINDGFECFGDVIDSMNGAQTDGENIPTRFPAASPLAMAYVPYQVFEALYDAPEALQRGTLFKKLDLPFERGAGR